MARQPIREISEEEMDADARFIENLRRTRDEARVACVDGSHALVSKYVEAGYTYAAIGNVFGMSERWAIDVFRDPQGEGRKLRMGQTRARIRDLKAQVAAAEQAALPV